MKTRPIWCLLIAGLSVFSAQAAERVLFDVAVPDKRKAVVEMAEQLMTPRPLAPLPEGGINPFDPVGFGQPDPEERAAELAAARAAQKAQANRPLNDRELLEAIAAKVTPSGTMVGRDGQPVLFIGKNSVKIGTKFTIPYSGIDYKLELTAIDRTTFTLRFNSEELIRPIKPAK